MVSQVRRRLENLLEDWKKGNKKNSTFANFAQVQKKWEDEVKRWIF